MWSLCDNSNPEGWFKEKLQYHRQSTVTHAYWAATGAGGIYARVPLPIDKGFPKTCRMKSCCLFPVLSPPAMGAEFSPAIQPGICSLSGVAVLLDYLQISAYMMGADALALTTAFPNAWRCKKTSQSGSYQLRKELMKRSKK